MKLMRAQARIIQGTRSRIMNLGATISGRMVALLDETDLQRYLHGLWRNAIRSKMELDRDHRKYHYRIQNVEIAEVEEPT